MSVDYLTVARQPVACRVMPTLPAPSALLPAFVGRQPIFDRRQAIHGYELLFRADAAAQPELVDGTVLTAQVVLNAFLELGIDTVVGPHRAFVNATRDFLVGGYATSLPPERIAIEVLEDVPPDPDVLCALRELGRAGYTIALDDFVFREELRPMIELAHLVKLDISLLDRPELARHVTLLGAYDVGLLAERVETREEFDHCLGLGFDYFQGFFLARPTIVHGQRRSRNQLSMLRLVVLLEDPSVPIDRIEEAISLDPTLSYRLLKVINSAAFGLSCEVESLRQALVLLGLKRIQSWVTMLVMAGLSKKPPALLASALTRAKMCEMLAAHLMPDRAASCFTVGLFSALDAMLDQPMGEILGAVPLSDDVRTALIEGAGPMGVLLQDVLRYERCAWDELSCPTITPAQFRAAYLEAIAWSRTLVDAGRHVH